MDGVYSIGQSLAWAIHAFHRAAAADGPAQPEYEALRMQPAGFPSAGLQKIPSAVLASLSFPQHATRQLPCPHVGPSDLGYHWVIKCTIWARLQMAFLCPAKQKIVGPVKNNRGLPARDQVCGSRSPLSLIILVRCFLGADRRGAGELDGNLLVFIYDGPQRPSAGGPEPILFYFLCRRNNVFFVRPTKLTIPVATYLS